MPKVWDTRYDTEYIIRITEAGNLDYYLEPVKDFQLLEVRLHLSGLSAASMFTMTLDSIIDPVYDVKIFEKDLNGLSDLFEIANPAKFEQGDRIRFQWANGGGLTWGLEIRYKTISY